MKLSKELKYNLLIVALLILLDFGWDFFTSSNKLPIKYSLLFTLTFSISFFTVYFVNYYYLLPRLFNTKKYILFGASVIFMVFVFAGIRFLLEEVLSPILFNINNYNINDQSIIFAYFFDSFIFSFKASLYSTLVYLFFRYRENKNKLHLLEIKHQQAQLTTLKSQISPHFLFNVLNGFYIELYDEQPETANDILKLSHLLRYVTYETSENFVLLEKEIQFLNDYLHFFKRRYESNFYVSLTINGNPKSYKIPSLILINFIENVCKHGVINNPNKPANINITIDDISLVVTTENHTNTSEKYMEIGIGTKNVRKRLEVLYNDNFSLTFQQSNNIFNTYLQFPL
ncbi:sensor histidine kinase [Tenacibaculum singaporense]|uniref:Signal transduction histidine kinase internal region domain-containing protein n=1 Tax=Tenacibaculum singaporense TaxID=2358479 RepID=A0A3S8RAC4_9FLAO|nr:histidine kinase [Tenacibaculum singaporense]AZJ36720.1 hypothetical protein D6T69_14725 [Tenacibaculum singaporense]